MSTELSTLSAAVAAVLAEADAEIASLRPVCRSSGRCCRFEEYGHRLYVTAAELAHFAHSLPPIENQKSKTENPRPISLPQFFAQEKPQGCPYQVGGLCTAREARPLGCRVYFCDENAQSWQGDLYERYHARLQQLHETHHLPYRYLEWRAALREIMSPPHERMNAPAP
jgi:Fe-S-cluster containining protein